MQNESSTASCVVPFEVRQAIIFERGRAIDVRVLGKTNDLIRLSTEKAFVLPSGAETVLQTESGDIRVRVIYKRLEGQSMLIGLQPLA